MDAASSDFKDKSTKKNFDQEEYGPWIKWNEKIYLPFHSSLKLKNVLYIY